MTFRSCETRAVSHGVVISNNLDVDNCNLAGDGGQGTGGAVSAYNMTGAMLFSADTFRNNSAAQGGIVAITDSPSAAVTMNNLTTADNTVR